MLSLRASLLPKALLWNESLWDHDNLCTLWGWVCQSCLVASGRGLCPGPNVLKESLNRHWRKQEQSEAEALIVPTSDAIFHQSCACASQCVRFGPAQHLCRCTAAARNLFHSSLLGGGGPSYSCSGLMPSQRFALSKYVQPLGPFKSVNRSRIMRRLYTFNLVSSTSLIRSSQHIFA